MWKAFKLVIAFLFVLGWGLAASALHVVWTGSSVIIIPKDRIGVSETYSDITKWTAEDVAAHPNVSRRLIATGKAEALAGVFEARDAEDLRKQILEAIERGPASKPALSMLDKARQVAHQATQVVQH